MDVRSDAELIDATLAGKSAAFDELMKRYERIVFKVAYSFCYLREDALDISQSAFLNAYRSLGSFRRDADFKTWVLRITYNEGIDFVRRRKKRAEETLDVETVHPAVDAAQERELMERDRTIRLQRGLEKMNTRHRTALVLRYLQGIPIAEIAGVMRCSEGMVKNILFRGVRTLRKAVTENP